MTTPKELEDLRFWLKEVIYAPQYAGNIINAVPKLISAIEAHQAKNEELAKEFRRLAATNSKLSKENAQNKYGYVHESVAAIWEQAAQMLEERLNG